MIQPGESLDLLLVGRLDLSEPVVELEVQSSGSGTVLLLAAFGLALSLLSKRFRTALILMLVGASLSGCGSSQNGPVVTSQSENVAASTTTVTLREAGSSIDLGTIEARGAIDGNPASIQVRDQSQLPGPALFFEVPVGEPEQ